MRLAVEDQFVMVETFVGRAAKEWDLLRFLVNNPGQALSCETLLEHVWAGQTFITPRTVDVHIAWLRQKLEDDPRSPAHIVTMRGEGYRFAVQPGARE